MTPQRVDAHATLALLACFHSDQPAARQHAEQAVAGRSGCRPGRAFATYTMGEVRLLENPAAAVEILELAMSQAEADRTAQIAEVARIALVSALVRPGRYDEALRVFPDLLHQLRRRADGRSCGPACASSPNCWWLAGVFRWLRRPDARRALSLTG